ncbi:MAG: AMP deaminase [Chaenotheca gracillima]|nr:MAG: AMP deaminase [Chaenotheca gracillima]
MVTSQHDSSSPISSSSQSRSSSAGSPSSQQMHPSHVPGSDESEEEEGEISSSGDEGSTPVEVQYVASDETHLKGVTQPSEVAAQARQGNKRKRSGSNFRADAWTLGESSNASIRHDHSQMTTPDPKKRGRLESISHSSERPGDKDRFRGRSNLIPSDRSQLPGSLWQSVFAFIPPPTLARLMAVNTRFRGFLSPSQSSLLEEPVLRQESPLQVVEANAVWAASRRLHCPGMPKPLEGRSEMKMWQLLYGRHCQSCGKLGDAEGRQAPSQPLEMDIGVPQDKVIIEIDILISSSIASPLLVALPFIFLGPANQTITPTILQMSSHAPQFQMTKRFYKGDIQEIKTQFEDVKALGAPAAEEWIKGLDQRGKEMTSDSARWERWLYGGGISNLPPSFWATVSDTPVNAPPFRATAHAEVADDASPNSASPKSTESRHGTESAIGKTLERHLATSRPTIHDRPPSDSASRGPYHSAHGPFQPPRVERNLREVNELKAARRAEIERRCADLDPPMSPAILHHMDSFQAAVQISTPLTDSAWEVLKPRLLGQRAMAEQKENDHIAQNRVYQAKYEERRQQEASLKETKEMQDKVWDELQTPIRERLGRYAQEIIKDYWKGGDEITNETSPKFAADVLIYVRKRFYDEIGEEDSAARRAGEDVKQDPAEGPPTRKLMLENMKWVFDTQIKPLTERYRKELFLCNGCDSNFKFYGFEGVIQHFAAKHTNELSVGSVVVHWRAEWPSFTPFHPDPSAAKAAFYAVPPPPPNGPPGHPAFPFGSSYGGYSQSPGLGAHPGPNGVPNYQAFSPTPYGHPQYEQYPGHSNGPFPPPPQYPGAPGPFHGPPQGYPPGNSNGYPGQHPGFPGPVPGYQGVPPPYPGPHQNAYGSPLPSHVHPAPIPGQLPPSGQPYGPPPPPYGPPTGPGQPNDHSYPYAPPSGPNQGPPGPPGPNGGMYHIQLEEMAKIARDVWTTTSGIKDLPSSVRTYIVIHQVISKFKSRFSNEPTLHMFIDGLANQALMKPIKNFNGLACRACGTSGSSGHGYPPAFPAADRKLYTLANLLNHFQTVHIEKNRSAGYNNPMSKADWKIDMVELPEQAVVSNLMHTPGMDDRKLHLIAQVFPDAFPRPLPKIGPAKNAGPVPVMQDASYETHSRNGQGRSKAGAGHTDTRRYNKHTNNGQRALPRNAHGNADSRGRAGAGGQPQDSNAPQQRAEKAQDDDRSSLSPGPQSFSQRQSRPSHKFSAGSKNDHEDYHQATGPIQRMVPEPPRRYMSASPGPNERTRSGPPNNSHVVHQPGSVTTHDQSGHADVGTVDGRGLSRQERRRNRRSHNNYANGPPNGGDVSKVPSLRALSSRQPQDTIMKDEGSEDGEVGDGPSSGGQRPRLEHAGEEPSEAAERFLDSFLPGEDTEVYKRKAAEHDRRREEETKRKAGPGREREQQQVVLTEDRTRKLAEEGSDTLSWRSEFDDPRAAHNGMPLAAGASYAPVIPRTSGQTSPLPRDVGRQPLQFSQDEQLVPSPARLTRQAERHSEFDSRYPQSRVTYQDERNMADVTRRPRSRYDRYESYRQDGAKARSRSPSGLVPHDAELHARDGSRGIASLPPERAYRVRSPGPASADRLPPDDPRYYQRADPQSAYLPSTYVTYANDPRGYAPVYPESMEYMPVRVSARSPPPGSYAVSHRPAANFGPEYERYEDEARGRQLYEDRGQFVRLERTVLREDDPRGHPTQHLRY